MTTAINRLLEQLPLLHLDHISICLTLRERGDRARRLWTRKGMPLQDAAWLSTYWKKRASTDSELARRIIGIYLEHYSKSGDSNSVIECNAQPENFDLLGLIESPGPYVEKSIRRVIADATGQPNTQRTEPPPITTQIATASKSLLNWAASGLKTVSPEELERRRAICAGCEFWESTAFQGTGRCSKCGCSTWAKLQMATEKCPIDKWSPV